MPARTRAARSAWPNCRSGFRWRSRRKWRFCRAGLRRRRVTRHPSRPTGALSTALRTLRRMFGQSVKSEALVMRPACVGKALLEGCELVVARPVWRETGRTFDGGVPVRRPHAIGCTRAWRPAEHTFAEANAELRA